MAKFQSPLLGYNNNVRYQGRVFHVQTEDSGVNHPHIITHLFMDGGRILKSIKTSYAQHVGIDGMSETVRVMMKDQHKAMVVALKEGQFDSLLDGGAKRPAAEASPKSLTPKVPLQAVPAPVVARLASAPPEDPVPVSVQVSTERRARREELVTHPTPLAIPLSNGVDALPPDLEALLRDELPPVQAPKAAPAPAPIVVPAPAPEAAAAVAVASEQKRSPSVRELTLDFDALERDAGEGSVFRKSTDLPPPPKNLFTREPRTAPYRAVDDVPNRVDVAPTARTPTRRPPSMRPASPGQQQPGASRPPPTAAATPKASLFSDNLVSDQSLDEVILSYLAEDLEPRRK